MKYSILLPFLLISFSSFAQEIAPAAPKTPKKKFQIGVNVSPDFCYRTLRNPNGGDTAAAIINRRNDLESSRIGYTAGINMQYRINGMVSLEGGVQFSSKGYEMKDLQITSLTNPTGELNDAKLIYEYQYIDIPVKANFFIGKKNLRFIGSAGVAANFLISDKAILKYLNSSEPKREITIAIERTNLFNLSPLISAGINYRINDWMNFRLEPTFRYSILKVQDAPIAQHLYSAGLNVGWYVGL